MAPLTQDIANLYGLSCLSDPSREIPLFYSKGLECLIYIVLKKDGRKEVPSPNRVNLSHGTCSTCTTSMSALRRSGLQKDVLSLYRRFAAICTTIISQFKSAFICFYSALRMVKTKPPSTQEKFSLYIRYNFRMNASNISPRDVSAIEHLIRKGKRQLEMYEQSSVKDIWISEDMQNWQKNNPSP